MNVLSIIKEQLLSIGIDYTLQEHFKELEVVSTSDHDEILRLIKEKEFDVILFDVGIYSLHADADALIENFKQSQENATILILASSDYKQHAMKYIGLGASGFLHKNSRGQDLILAIQLIRSGQLYMSKDLLMSIYNNNISSDGNAYKNNNPIHKLSKKELEVFNMIIQGKRVKDISKTLKIHQSTVSTLKKRILLKCKVDNLMKLKTMAMEYGY